MFKHYSGYFFVENFYKIDKTSIILLLEKIGKSFIIHNRNSRKIKSKWTRLKIKFFNNVYSFREECDKTWNQNFMKKKSY